MTIRDEAIAAGNAKYYGRRTYWEDMAHELERLAESVGPDCVGPYTVRSRCTGQAVSRHRLARCAIDKRAAGSANTVITVKLVEVIA